MRVDGDGKGNERVRGVVVRGGEAGRVYAAGDVRAVWRAGAVCEAVGLGAALKVVFNEEGRPFRGGRPFLVYPALWNYLPSRASTFCGEAFAWESTDVVACTRIWARVSAAVSSAKSASR